MYLTYGKSKTTTKMGTFQPKSKFKHKICHIFFPLRSFSSTSSSRDLKCFIAYRAFVFCSVTTFQRIHVCLNNRNIYSLFGSVRSFMCTHNESEFHRIFRMVEINNGQCLCIAFCIIDSHVILFAKYIYFRAVPKKIGNIQLISRTDT